MTQRRRGPREGRPDTRSAILESARAEFVDAGFTGATVRAIAARAGVDPSLIHHYFGSKSALFDAVLAATYQPEVIIPAMVDGPRDELGERVARTFLTAFTDDTRRSTILGFARAALGQPGAASQFRDFIESRMLPALEAAAGGGPEARRRAELAMTSLFGVVLARHALGLEDLSALGIEELVDEVAPTIQRYFDGTHRVPVRG